MINLGDEKNEFDINEPIYTKKNTDDINTSLYLVDTYEDIDMKTIIDEKYSQDLKVDLKNISNAFDILESAGLTVNEIYLNYKSFQF